MNLEQTVGQAATLQLLFVYTRNFAGQTPRLRFAPLGMTFQFIIYYWLFNIRIGIKIAGFWS
jgi:hypothetical protein